MVSGFPKLKVQKKKPGPEPRPAEEIRGGRLTLRVHDDLMKLLTQRGRENSLSRSAYIERLLLAWLRADPRNPKMDPIGRVVEGAPTPLELLEEEPSKMGRKWEKFSQAHELLFGQGAPIHWFEEPESYWTPIDMDSPPEDEETPEEANKRFRDWQKARQADRKKRK